MLDDVIHDIAKWAEKHHNGKNLAEFIAGHICKATSIQARRGKLAKKKQALEEKFREDSAALMLEETKIMATCPHPSTTYYGDAAGGSDSYTECNICGKEL